MAILRAFCGQKSKCHLNNPIARRSNSGWLRPCPRSGPGSAAAGGLALINSIANLGGFVGPYAIGWIKDATGETTLGLVVVAACSIMAGIITFLMGHDSKIEMAGSRMMAE